MLGHVFISATSKCRSGPEIPVALSASEGCEHFRLLSNSPEAEHKCINSKRKSHGLLLGCDNNGDIGKGPKLELIVGNAISHIGWQRNGNPVDLPERARISRC